MNEKQKIEQKLLQDIKTKKEIISIAGAFGDIENCDGYIEERKEDEDGGILVKFYGCSYFFKGWPKNEIVEGIGLAKSMVSVFPRVILGNSRVLQGFLLGCYIFYRKKLFHWLNVYFAMIHGHVTQKVGFDPRNYNRCVKELRRCFLKKINEWDETILTRNRDILIYPNYPEKDIKGKNEERSIVKTALHAGEFFFLFIEHDNAYRFPLQDILPNLDKEKLKENSRKEILRLFDLCIERATNEGILGKAKEMRKIVSLILRSKKISNVSKEFLLELDMEKIKMDEHDLYFSLNRKGYNTNGLSYEERMSMKNKIDEEKNHYYLQLLDITIGDKLKGFRVVRFGDVTDVKNRQYIA